MENQLEKLTVREAAELKGCSKSTILQLIRRSILPAERIGTLLVIPRYAVDAYNLPGKGKGPRMRARKKFSKPENST